MKIDTHQHYWQFSKADFPWIQGELSDLGCDYLPPDIFHHMDACGVTSSIAVQARIKKKETDFLLKLCTAYSEKLAGTIGWLDLKSANFSEELEEYLEQPYFLGLRHILQDETSVSDWVTHSNVLSSMQTIQKNQLVYEVLVVERQLAEVIEFCKKCQNHWLILDHLGKPNIATWHQDPAMATSWKHHVKRLSEMPHIACKISGLVTETGIFSLGKLTAQHMQAIYECLNYALDCFGPDRLIFGSDWPVSSITATYNEVYQMTEKWILQTFSDNEQEKFWYQNAMKIYNLKQPKK